MKKIMVLSMIFVFCILQIKVSAISHTATSVCVINSLTGDVVLSENQNEKRPMASTTKIMTAIIALETCELDEIVSVSENAAMQEGSSAYLKTGDKIRMEDLLYGLMLNSGNDAATAIAEHIAGDEKSFAQLMNEKTNELQLSNTHFENASGLDGTEHYTTAYELALISRYAMSIPKFREIVQTKNIVVSLVDTEAVLKFNNHNKLLNLYDGANGIKTGYTKSAGRCLVSSANRDGMEFISVTLCDPNDWNDHKAFLDYAFSEHYPKAVIKKGDVIKRATIDGKKYCFTAKDDFTVPFKEHQKINVDIITHIVSDLNPPINENEKVGYMEILYNKKKIGEVDIVSQSDIYGVSEIRIKNSFFDSFLRTAKILLIN